ncbi:MAG: AmmeMemoRadiSam system protein B [Bacteroidales bacterium]|nr:AmmeMemoRadiSam system protein B [Bacteroidales bacterium]
MQFGNATKREPAFAGSFYPADKSAVLELLHEFDKNSKDILADFYESFDLSGVHGLIVPHAGWAYSGKTAFLAYQLLKECQCQKIALLGPSHRHLFQGAFADNHDFWETPLGECSIIKDAYFEVSNNTHEREHSLEVQMPFIQYFSPSSRVLPLVVSEMTKSLAGDYAQHLIEENYFVIISSDLSHFHSLEQARKIDARTIASIEEKDGTNIEACGSNPLKIGFALMRERNLTPHLIHYSTSAEAFGDTTSVVGYASFWF